MKWSLKLGSIDGIGVYLHWTFVLLIGWIFLGSLGAGRTPGEALAGVGFILALFACVLLHEFGHALTAKRYGVSTRDITLLPIGGVARMERIPEQPMQEFWVAVAGPAVNAVIAALLFLILLLLGRADPMVAIGGIPSGFLEQLMWVNLFIGAFNLLPALPMDGGRVLRALLSLRPGRLRATAIAANLGRNPLFPASGPPMGFLSGLHLKSNFLATAGFLRGHVDPANPADAALTDEQGAGGHFLVLDQLCLHPQTSFQ